MLARLEMSGGMAAAPALQRPIVLDSREIETVEAAKLWRLMTDADFFALPARVNPSAPAAAGGCRYTLTIEDGARRHSVTFEDPVSDSRLVSLRDFVRDRGASQ